MSATARLVAKIDLKVTEQEVQDLGTAQKIHELVKDIVLANGTSASQVDLVWSDRRSLAATTEELDLAGSLTSALGATLTFAEVVAIAIYNRNTTAAEVLTVGGAASNGFITPFGDATDKIKVGPSGLLLLINPVDGFAVTAGTGDKLKLDAGAATISYDIVIVGRSA